MDLISFVACLKVAARSAAWTVRGDGSVRVAGDNLFAEDTVTFLANYLLGYQRFTPTQPIETAVYLQMDSKLVLRIVSANDDRGEPEIRDLLLDAVSLKTFDKRDQSRPFERQGSTLRGL